MKTLIPATLAAVFALTATLPADANPRNGRGNGNGAWTEDGFCPPGLRDRNRACVPPGQARRAGDRDDRRELRPDDLLGEIVRQVDDRDDEDRDKAQALAIIGTLMGLALLEQNAQERQEEAVPAPVAPEPETPAFSFSEVPSRPASIERLAAAYGSFGDALDPGLPVIAESPAATLATPVLPAEPPAAAPSPRIVPLGEPLPGPVPTPQEEAILSDVFRRATEEGATGY